MLVKVLGASMKSGLNVEIEVTKAPRMKKSVLVCGLDGGGGVARLQQRGDVDDVLVEAGHAARRRR